MIGARSKWERGVGSAYHAIAHECYYQMVGLTVLSQPLR